MRVRSGDETYAHMTGRGRQRERRKGISTVAEPNLQRRRQHYAPLKIERFGVRRVDVQYLADEFAGESWLSCE